MMTKDGRIKPDIKVTLKQKGLLSIRPVFAYLFLLFNFFHLLVLLNFFHLINGGSI